jgi:hypothetical protein
MPFSLSSISAIPCVDPVKCWCVDRCSAGPSVCKKAVVVAVHCVCPAAGSGHARSAFDRA